MIINFRKNYHVICVVLDLVYLSEFKYAKKNFEILTKL